MTTDPPLQTQPATPWRMAGTPAATATPAGHLVCDVNGRVCWTDELAGDLLAAARVLLLQADGRLGVRSHWLGLLALRSAMRMACLGTPPLPVTLRHDRHELQVGVHALPEAADGSQRVLLSLRPSALPTGAVPPTRGETP